MFACLFFYGLRRSTNLPLCISHFFQKIEGFAGLPYKMISMDN